MSGISSSTGLISGINTSQIIAQLVAIDSRPKVLAQTRLAQLQQQQAAFLDINSKLGGVRTAATKLRLSKLFTGATATSSEPSVLSATAGSGAVPGAYSFLVDRTVSSQQLLSRGFADRAAGSPGITSITVESAKARLDSDTDLAQLNGGNGVSRGQIIVTDRAGTTTTIDLSRVATVNDVLGAFNNNAGLKVRASVQGGRIVLTDASGGTGSLTVASAAGYTTAESLGINKSVAGAALTGDSVYALGDSTSIQSLNDGAGIRFNNGGAINTVSPDFTIKTRDGSSYDIDISEMYNSTEKTANPVSTIGQLRQRILDQTAGKVTVQVSGDGRSINLVDSTAGSDNFEVIDIKGAAADLRIVGSTATDTIAGGAVLAGLNSTLASGLRGGQGLGSGVINATLHDGTVLALDISNLSSVTDILSAFAGQSGGKLTAQLGANGTSFIITDTTSGSTNLELSGAGADALGITTAVGGVASANITSTRASRRYVAESTLLSQLNNGLGVGTGSFEIQGPTAGSKATINIDSTTRTVGQLIDKINSTGIGVRARVNDAGNGILIEKDPSVTTEAVKIRVADTNGTAARALNLVGEATDLGISNVIDGSFRRVVSFTPTDSLDQVVSKLNSARAGLSASVVTDGASGNPYRLRLSATQAGAAGRFIVDSEGADLGLATVAQGENARVFFGADDPARAILVSRASNTIDGVVDGIRIDVKAASSSRVTVNVARDNDSVVTAVQDFITSFNTLSTRVNDLTRYNSATQQRGTLLGDSTAVGLRAELLAVIGGAATGISGQYRNLAQVGVTIGKDGTLNLDSNKLRAALDSDQQAVADVFSAFVQNDRPTSVPVLDGVTGITASNTGPDTFSSLGVLERIGKLADRYLDSASGLLTARTRNFDDLVRAQNDRITAFNTRIASKQAFYEKQFAALESTLANLQSQQNALAGLSR